MNPPTPGTLAETLRANARYHGDTLAVRCNGRSLTHAELYARARRLAAAWAGAGLQPMDRVSVLAMNEIEYFELYAAAELSGVVLATLNFRLAVPELAYILKDSAPRHLVFEAQYLPVVEQLRAQLPGIEKYACIGGETPWARNYEHYLQQGVQEGVQEGKAAFEPVPPSTGDLAYLVYTSGTTGRPKGCMLGQRAMTSFAETLSGVMQSSPSDRTLLMMPMFHVGAKMIQLGAHWQGGSVVLHRSFDAKAILETIERERITVTHMAPTMIQMLLDHPDIRRHDLSSLRMLVYSAAAMPVALLRRGLELLGPIFTQMYGQTEGAGTVLPAAHHRPDGNERDRERFKSIGVPMRGTEVRIVDAQERDCAPGAAGEIVIRGPMCMQGYWNNSAATLETLRGGWLHTGDVGRFDDDGFIYLVDRMKDVIVSGGENIYSREVEEALYEHPAVCEVAVIGEPDAKWGEAVCAVLALQAGAAADEDQLTAFCRERIAGYKRPRRYVFVTALPKLPSGKIDKREVRRLHGRSAT
jgi:acyl-CoA synthetase (AMP-forming)/AMP-acid ligase II